MFVFSRILKLVRLMQLIAVWNTSRSMSIDNMWIEKKYFYDLVTEKMEAFMTS